MSTHTTIDNIDDCDDMAFYRGDLLTAGEDGQVHFQTIKSQMLGAGDRYRYPAGHAQAGQLDGRPGSAAVNFALTTIDPAMVTEFYSKDGPEDNDDDRCQVQAHRVPDTATVVRQRSSLCTLSEIENYFTRQAFASVTVDTLCSRLDGMQFEPPEEIAKWFTAVCRVRDQLAGSMTDREFHKTLAGLLPGENEMHPKLFEMRHPPVPLKKVAQRIRTETRSQVRKLLQDTIVEMENEARRQGIKGARWWADEEQDAKAMKKAGMICNVTESAESEELQQLKERLATTEKNIVAMRTGQDTSQGTDEQGALDAAQAVALQAAQTVAAIMTGGNVEVAQQIIAAVTGGSNTSLAQNAQQQIAQLQKAPAQAPIQPVQNGG